MKIFATIIAGLVLAVLTLLAAILLLTTYAHAAEMRYDPTSKVNFIQVNGQIVVGDYEQFVQTVSTSVSSSNPLVVVLNSNGGNVITALRIGEFIRARGYHTAVNSMCASSCGLIWLAGNKRWASETAKIGFHSAFEKGTVTVNGPANALIGAYLSKLGLSSEAIIFATAALPDNMQWLHPAEAKAMGIDLTILSSAPEPRPVEIKRVENVDIPARSTAVARPQASSSETQAKRVVQMYYSAWSNGINIFPYYADTVMFYGPFIPRVNVMADRDRFAQRWPLRQYKVRTMTATCKSDTCTVSGIVDWDVASLARGARSFGSSSFLIGTDGGRIFSESGSVIEKHSN